MVFCYCPIIDHHAQPFPWGVCQSAPAADWGAATEPWPTASIGEPQLGADVSKDIQSRLLIGMEEPVSLPDLDESLFDLLLAGVTHGFE